ncbi:MAG: penicillin-binding protein 2 [Marinovum sp.]|jgi:cell division protein FtsI (penicillin-binding protein 3)|nr:penicillin-binding protein 2 [Marinovum sp.]MBT6506490.1 penicillin-binding protein 2 [Marinovum sp.]MBT6531770.1 penicillin-binding protein 2 [Marinovum sp.]MBT7905939.1 penicillin-binding protein 2 [Marinovum sp.]MDG2230109.1 penicillin-binding protein 2 [Paracoccaceae bacterium]
MSDMPLRAPLRPLSQILPARDRGENPDIIERKNIELRHETQRDPARARAQGRLLVLGIMFICIFAVITVRIGLLSASEPIEPRSQKAGASIIAQRADIVDRRGRILATNMETHSLYVETAHLVDAQGTARALAQVFPDLDADRLFKAFTGQRKFLWIKKKLSPEQMQAAHDIGDPGLRFGPREMRLYPNGNLAAHVLGGASFGREGVHAAEVVGVAGVEKSFDERLRDPAQSGAPLQLSIDLSVQAAVEQVLYGGMQLLNAKGAAAILMDVHTGEVLSLASLPNFDPNNRPSLPAKLKAADSPLFNRALQGVYELGSTFKIFAVSQALQMGMVTPETIIDIRGPIRWGKFRIKDYHNYGAKLPVFEVITKSSNIGAARIAQMIGAEEQKRFLTSLGFLAPIPIEMPEAKGGRPLVPSKWTELSTMTISYGHGLSATPLHLAVGYAAIANGGYKVTPTLVPNPTVAKGERVLSETVSKQSVDMLRSVVTDGTASFGEVAGYAVAGKTGTADKPNPQGAYHEEKVISTFASIFPANDPKYVLVVSLDEPEDRTGSEPRRTAGWTAVPVAAEIIGRIAPLLGMRPLIEKQTRADITLTSTN